MGIAVFGLIAGFFYGVVSGEGGDADYLGFLDTDAWVGALSLGWKGSVGDLVGYVILILLTVAAGGLAILLVAFRDADAEAVAEINNGELPPAQGQTTTNYWPVIGAFGAGVLVIGLATHIAIFVVGLLILGATAFEWMMSAWADRATGDPVANQELRDRIMKPVEVPVLGAVGIAVLVLSASRLFLTVSEAWAVWAAVIMSGVIFLGAVAFALAENVNKNLMAGVLALGAVAAITTGIVSASIGEREIEHHGEHGEETEHEGEEDDHGDYGDEEGALGW
jgi:hypothetical protein